MYFFFMCAIYFVVKSFAFMKKTVEDGVKLYQE